MGSTCCPPVERTESQHPGTYKAISQTYENLPTQAKISQNPKYSRGDVQLNKLLLFLIEENQNFVDQICSCQSLISKQKLVNVKWKRLSQLFIDESYKAQNWQFNYVDEKQVFYNKSFVEAMNWLKYQPKLLEEICLYPQICKAGMYRFFCHPGGGEKTEVLIDDFIPVGNHGQYLYSRPKPGGGIWMILLQKALAKVLGSYQKINYLKRQQILSELTGYPSMHLYQPGHTINSLSISLKGKSSKYIKIFFNQVFHFILCLWSSPSINTFDLRDPHKNIIVQIIQDTGDKVYEIQSQKFTNQNFRNMTIVGNAGGMVKAKQEKVLVHVYNRVNEDIVTNFVVQADKNIFMGVQTDKSKCELVKYNMIQTHYQSRHLAIEGIVISAYKLRILWTKHRGIFCLKNISKNYCKYTFLIKAEYRDKIIFEDDAHESRKECQIKPDCHCLLIVNRAHDQQYGLFYEITYENI